MIIPHTVLESIPEVSNIRTMGLGKLGKAQHIWPWEAFYPVPIIFGLPSFALLIAAPLPRQGKQLGKGQTKREGGAAKVLGEPNYYMDHPFSSAASVKVSLYRPLFSC